MPKTILILDDIRSTHNVGSIMRTADGFGVQTLYICGYTPYPEIPNDPRLPHEIRNITNAIHKTALGAESTIEIVMFPTVTDAIKHAKKKHYIIAGLEQSERSTNIVGFKSDKDIAILVGNEVNGIASDTLAHCDVILEIPMYGKKESFNVSVATAICIYELTQKNDTPTLST